MLASGPDSVRDLVQPVFDAIGSRTVWVGDAGGGSRLKLTANAWVGTMLEGIADSMALTRDLGLDPSLFLEAIAGGAMDAPYVQLKGKAMLSGQLRTRSSPWPARSRTSTWCWQRRRRRGTDLGLIPGVRAHLARAVDAGHGDLDMAATYLGH